MVAQNTQAYTEFLNQQLETVLRVSKIGLDSSERLARLQIDTAKQTIEQLAQTTSRLNEPRDLQSTLALRAELTQQIVESSLGLSRNLYELYSQTQTELSQLFEERLNTFNRSVVSAMDRAARSAPAGTDVMVSSVKSTVAATAAAVDSMTKAAKQVAEFADASVKAATTATSDAVKSASRVN
ncbi:phasin family protein [Chitinimonas lacunae]|uniref:Phasin family protein n=1 Tax=Chitinimonas lacunae TaxID=1963018 RepID=A0ABV8MLG3_9NEIS